MKRIVGLVIAFMLLLTACGSGTTQQEPPPPSPSPASHIEQVKTLVADLGDAGMVIDEIADRDAPGGKRQNAHFEQETEAKERKVTKCSSSAKNKTCKTETTKLTTKEYVAEVTVVISGNCKAQIERLLDVNSTSYYFDESWDERGNEVPVDTNSPYSFMPTPTALETYFSDLGPQQRAFTFCRGKERKPSPAGRN